MMFQWLKYNLAEVLRYVHVCLGKYTMIFVDKNRCPLTFLLVSYSSPGQNVNYDTPVRYQFQDTEYMAQRAKVCVTVRAISVSLAPILSTYAKHIVMHLHHYILVFI